MASIVLLGLGPVQFAPARQLELLYCVLLCFLYSRRPCTELHSFVRSACSICTALKELLAPDDSPFLDHGFLQGAVLSGAMFKGSPVRSQQYAKTREIQGLEETGCQHLREVVVCLRCDGPMIMGHQHGMKQSTCYL